MSATAVTPLPASRRALPVLATALRRGGGDRGRSAWTAAALAGATAFGCAAVAIAGLWRRDEPAHCVTNTVTAADGSVSTGLVCIEYRTHLDLAPYVAQPGVRVGVVIGALLLVVPFLGLAVQALRFGSAARERRLAALALAGAGQAELRRLGAVEAVRAAAPGVLGGAPLYLLLWLALGVLAPSGSRMLPRTPWSGLLGWTVVALAATGFAAAAGAGGARPAELTPTGPVRRSPRPLGRWRLAVPVVFLAGLVIGCVALVLHAGGDALVALVVIPCLVAFLLSLGSPLTAAVGRLLVRRGDPVRVLAGRRLLADPRTPGRVGAVLLTVGLAFGIEFVFVGDVLGRMVFGPESGRDDVSFYLVGAGIAALGTVLAALVAVLSLVVGAAEQVLDGARPTAALVALGAARSDVRAVLATWLAGAAVPPAVVGCLLGDVLYGGPVVAEPAGWPVAGALAAVLVTVTVVLAGTRLAARLLRSRLDASMTVENLRAP